MSPFNKIVSLFRRGPPDCVEVRKLSSEYLEEELKQSRMQQIRAHLEGCGPCKAFVESLASTIGLLARLPRRESSSSLKQTIKERIKEG